eukprot:TRINITY_DN24814_c0_g1_i1.p1 TRINITY_DN24814_c0_g1~~TRINITY_DN24814_c0_g1_i1.p1  ORF type:complete len:291 (+),score=93.15 TRINITY_DN24814_c0_g1_i1:45-875(+)
MRPQPVPLPPLLAALAAMSIRAQLMGHASEAMQDGEMIELTRCNMTLSEVAYEVVYSPNEGVMTTSYPKYKFDTDEFRAMVGWPLSSVREGTRVWFTVTSYNEYEGIRGVFNRDSVCRITRVEGGAKGPRTQMPDLQQPVEQHPFLQQPDGGFADFQPAFGHPGVPDGVEARPDGDEGSEEEEQDPPEGEQSITLERTHMTLSKKDGNVIYSPKEGVMTHRYPKFIFDAEEFESMVGPVRGVKSGTVLTYTVDQLTTRSSGGFCYPESVCTIVSVD